MLEKADKWYEDCKEKAYCVIIRYHIKSTLKCLTQLCNHLIFEVP